MDRRTFLAVLLSVTVFSVWSALFGPEPPTPEEAAALAEAAEQGETAPAPAPEAVEPAPAPVPELPEVTEQEVMLSMCGGTGTLSSFDGLSGMSLAAYEGPYEVMPFYSWLWGTVTGSVSGGWHPYGASEPGPAEVLTPEARALTVGTGSSPTDGDSARMAIVERTDDAVVLRGMTATGIEVTQEIYEGLYDWEAEKPVLHRKGTDAYRRLEDSGNGVCLIGMNVSWRNRSSVPVDQGLWLGIYEVANQSGSGMTARYNSQRQPTAVTDDDLSYGGPNGAGCVTAGTRLEDEKTEFPLEGPVSWFGISDRYFGFYVLPDEPSAGSAFLSRIGQGEEALDGTHWAVTTRLDAGETRTESFRIYAGPNDLDALGRVDESLQDVVDLGWFEFFGYPLLIMLRFFYSAVGNWGISIVMLTLVVKALFFPMTQSSFKSMQKMQRIQPMLNELREKHSDNPQELNQKTIALMQEHGVNPAAGCLPMFVQMPVWIALYNVLLTSVDLYHTEFLYLRDLTQPDPYLVLPITIMALMFIQQRFSTPSNVSPEQQQIMRFMPLFFGLLFFAFPSGLAVYVFVNILLSNLQQWWIKRNLDTADPPAAAAAT
ncbi:MAG: membrane protein insertase YidC [Myxococcota bacterium]